MHLLCELGAFAVIYSHRRDEVNAKIYNFTLKHKYKFMIINILKIFVKPKSIMQIKISRFKLF